MSLHEQLYRWTAEQGLDDTRARRLWALSGLDQAPPDALGRLRLGAAGLAAGLLGLGTMMWVAANWGELPRSTRFLLLQGLLAAALLGAWARPAWRGFAPKSAKRLPLERLLKNQCPLHLPLKMSCPVPSSRLFST